MSDLLRLRARCEHGQYDSHYVWDPDKGRKVPGGCTGGREVVLRRLEFGKRSLYPKAVYVVVEDE